MAGRSSKSYNNDGRLDKILTEMHPGDYVFIQFGINDGAVNKPERYISVEDYKTLITEKYMGEVIKRGGTPVLMTANPAAWWDEEKGNFMESRQDYADPTREIAKETGCAFIDANRIVTDAWNTMEKDDVISGYFVCEPLESKAYPAGTNDTTHMKPKGAKRVAEMIAKAIKTDVPELAQYLKGESVFTDIEGHWGETYIKTLADEGLIDGVGDGKFNPDGTVTRAEFLKMTMDATGIVGHAYREGECLDATEEDWYCYYLQGALDKDIIPEKMIENVSSEKFTKTLAEKTDKADAVTTDVTVYKGAYNGNKPITREEMAAILMECLSYECRFASDWDMSLYKETPLADINEVSEEYKWNVIFAYNYGCVSGREDGRFAPKDNLTRAEATVVIGKYANLIERDRRLI